MCSGTTVSELAVWGLGHSGFGHLLDGYSHFPNSGKQIKIIFLGELDIFLFLFLFFSSLHSDVLYRTLQLMLSET